MKKLLIRTASGAVYVLLMLFAIYGGKLLGTGNQDITGSIIFCSIFFVIADIGAFEVVHNLRLANRSVNGVLALILSCLSFLLLSPFGLLCIPIISIVALFPFLVMLTQLWRHDEHPMECIGNTLLPLFWVILPLVMLSFLHMVSPGIVMMLFILIWVNDSFAYLTGMLLGRHKMWERHSPGKTWEGTAGGFLFCVATAIFVGPLFNTPVNSWWIWMAIGILTSIAGTLGDLVESMFKRSCGVKDSGRIMPGHGGILDRFDSTMIVGPLVEVLVLIIPFAVK